MGWDWGEEKYRNFYKNETGVKDNIGLCKRVTRPRERRTPLQRREEVRK